VSKAVAQEIHNKAEPFLKWLAEAEEEESSDDDDEVEVTRFLVYKIMCHSFTLIVMPSKKSGHIALHMSLSLSVTFRFRSITQEHLELPSSNFSHTFVLGSRGTLMILGSRVKCVKTFSDFK